MAILLLFGFLLIQSFAVSSDEEAPITPSLSISAPFQTDDATRLEDEAMNVSFDLPAREELDAMVQVIATTPAADPGPDNPPTDELPEDEPVANVEEAKAAAQEPEKKELRTLPLETPPHRTIRVRKGDSLWLIARRTGMNVGKLMHLNGLKTACIHPGQTLRVTGVSTEDMPREEPVGPPRSAERSDDATEHDEKVSKVLTYRVQRGDTLVGISERFSISVSDLMLENGILDGRRLVAGQILRLTRPRTIVHSVRKGETLWNIARRYGVTLNVLREENPLQGLSIRPGQKLEVPVTDGLRRRRQLGTGGTKKGGEQWSWPYRGRISDRFGMRMHPILKRPCLHCGLDIAARIGTRIRVPRNGIVTFAGWLRGYGRCVVVKHKGGYVTKYAHLSKFKCAAGDVLRKGQILALSGNSGLSTGPHLHFEIRHEGRPIDPLPLLQGRG